MSGISSVGSSMSAASYSPLDKNHDGVVDAQELQEAAQSGLLSASITSDEDSDDSSDEQSATGAFSGNLASMLLQMQQNSAAGTGQTSTNSSSDGSSDQSQSPIDQLFASLDTNHDGKVSSDEFVAGRPKDMSESDAQNLFKSLDSQSSGSLNKDQFAEGLDVLKSTGDSSATDMLSLESSSSDSSSTSTGGTADQNALEAFISEMQASMNAYQNTYGQYDPDPTDSVAA